MTAYIHAYMPTFENVVIEVFVELHVRLGPHPRKVPANEDVHVVACVRPFLVKQDECVGGLGVYSCFTYPSGWTTLTARPREEDGALFPKD